MSHTQTSQEWLTPNYVFTFAGASTAVVIVSNVITNVFRLTSDQTRTAGLALALVLGVIAAHYSKRSRARITVATVFIGLLNGCLLYCTVSGLGQTAYSILSTDNSKPIVATEIQTPVATELGMQPNQTATSIATTPTPVAILSPTILPVIPVNNLIAPTNPLLAPWFQTNLSVGYAR